MAENSPIPTDPFDQQLSRLLGLPGGAHTQPAVIQTLDFYGNATQWTSQVVKTDEGDYVFLTRVSGETVARAVLPARVLATIDRQRGTVTTKVRRRNGRRLADERKARGEKPAFQSNRKGGK